MICLMTKIVEKQGQCQLIEGCQACVTERQTKERTTDQDNQSVNEQVNMNVDEQCSRPDKSSKAEDGWTVVSRGRKVRRDSSSTNSDTKSRPSTFRGGSAQDSQRFVVVNLDDLNEREKKKKLITSHHCGGIFCFTLFLSFS